MKPVSKSVFLGIAHLLLGATVGALGVGTSSSQPSAPVLSVPFVGHEPTLEDFLTMAPSKEWEGKLASVKEFTQIRPGNGSPPTQRTVAYLGYDHKNLYVIFVCFDDEPKKIRARMSPREQFVDQTGAGVDDLVSVSLDTFHDRRRGYAFQVNPLGVQWDAVFSEDAGFDSSFDAVWSSKGKLTDKGYVVWLALPFKSLRFAPSDVQTWGILLNRDIPRNNESLYWPRYDTNVTGYMNKEATLAGMKGISPGRNIQFVPYTSLRSFRTLDLNDPNAPRFTSRAAEVTAGLDTKLVIKDSLVLDLTANPDFSQVESDEPQVTVNQRFAVFFPEKRPFFLENSGFFVTPNNLLFTRQIEDPQFGARLTGKIGGTAIGALLVDDRSPGEGLSPGDPLEGKRALFGVVRVNQDIFGQSTVGLIYTDREFAGSFNRVGGIDSRLRLNEHWIVSGQAVVSDTRDVTGSRERGSAYDFAASRIGRQFVYLFTFDDRSPGFVTLAGFLPRNDIREFRNTAIYTFRPEGKHIVTWGPQVQWYEAWDHEQHLLDRVTTFTMSAEFPHANFVNAFFAPESEGLGPRDTPSLAQFREYDPWTAGVEVQSRRFGPALLDLQWQWGRSVNINPAAGADPELGQQTSANVTLSLRPMQKLRIDNTYLLSRLTDQNGNGGIFDNYVVRSKWNWQFTKELSVRLILEYDAVLANPLRTSLSTTKQFNADFLFTYLPHPGTAIYVGYNSDWQNIDLSLIPLGPQIVRNNQLTNDAKGLFVKASYLFRF